MQRTSRSLTEREIESARAPEGGRLTLKAGPPQGLIVRVTARRKVFAVWFRVKGTTTKGLWELGDFPRLRLAVARDLANDVKANARRGIDPREAERLERRKVEEAKQEAITVTELVRRFIESRALSLAPSSAKEYRRSLAANIEPSTLGATPVRDVRRIEVREFLDGIARKTPAMARSLHRLLRTATRWGLELELLDADPLSAVRMPRAVPRSRVLSDEELGDYWKALDAAPPLVAAVLRLQTLTAVRFPSELLTARWRDVDLAARRWSIPAEYRKGKRALVLPLSDLAVRLLRQLSVSDGSTDRIFASLTVRSQLDYWFKKAAADVGGERFTPHDVRRTVASGIVRLGFGSAATADAILGHSLKGTAAVYIHAAPLPEMAGALERWGRHVETLVTDEHQRASVVPMLR